jgi:hypothetical protein
VVRVVETWLGNQWVAASLHEAAQAAAAARHLTPADIFREILDRAVPAGNA